MYEQWKMGKAEVGPAPRTGLKLQYKGHSRYTKVLQSAFPSPARWFGPYESYDEAYDWVLFVQDLPEDPIRRFIGFLQETLLFPTTLDECWAMAGHMADAGRTEIGELVYGAKTYEGKTGDPRVAEILAERLTARFQQHPAIARAEVILGIPANPPKTPHNLPDVLARKMRDALGLPDQEGILVKTRETRPLKDLSNPEKLAELEGAFSLTQSIAGKAVVLVDDLLFSGSTLNSVGQVLREGGAARVIGVAATKTLRT